MIDLSTAQLAWLTGVLTFLLTAWKFWKGIVVPKLVAPVQKHFDLVHESARAVQANRQDLRRIEQDLVNINLDLDKIKNELNPNDALSLQTLVQTLHKDLKATGRSLSRLQGLVQAILSASKEGVWLSDENGSLLWVNGWFAENIGWMPHEMEGAGWKNTIHPDYRQMVFAEWEACLREHRQFIMEFAYTTKSGDKVMVSAHCSPMKQNIDGVIVGHVGFVQPPANN